MKKPLMAAMAFAVLTAMPAAGVVFVNEIIINSPGSASQSDRFFEFIELMGTPGKKLDGYALAIGNGGLQKLYPAGSQAICPNEIDEFFSLDGLELGPNGTLVLGKEFASDYPNLLADANFHAWITNPLWNGLLDTPGNLNNDGSNTVLLVRNRPGDTEATNPTGPVVDLRWGKDVAPDCEFIPNAVEDPPGTFFDQWGNGNFDKGEPLGVGGIFTLDLKGASTLLDVSDDLEVVDEVSYEHKKGWEYDLDDRIVDLASTNNSLPQRNVHTLDDPQGINPDALTRVDYRTKGLGYPAVAGATGQLPNGNNWQDTATEQWIRGELRTASGGGTNPPYFYDNAPETNPDAVQPYQTQVPTWLADGTSPDFDFTTVNAYPVMAGRINPLATPFIPGDADRDGDADQDDIDKIAAVFGDDDFIFSNSFELAPEGDENDPATQTRPWDVDATGDNGFEASDLQWTLNFQGDTTGQIVGIQYDSTTPAATGVTLSDNAGTACTVSVMSNVPNGRPLAGLHFGDRFELTVRAEVTANANTTAGEENGVMQFVHDFVSSTGGVFKIESMQKLSPFSSTRASLETVQGTNGDLGVTLINGYTTSFTEGVAGAADLYRITLRAIAVGSTTITLSPAAEAKFAASTPDGLKIGHTASNGNPASSSYPAAFDVNVVAGFGDTNGNGMIDDTDIAGFVGCLSGPDGGVGVDCDVFNSDMDNDVDLKDFAAFQRASGL